MKVFISHATADASIALPFQKLFVDGTGLKLGDVFCSSKRSIPNGDYFVQNILTKLVEASLTVSLLSPNYFASQFCVTELGTAISRHFDEAAKFCSFVIPPLGFADLKGMMTGMQSDHLLDAEALDKLRQHIPAEKLIGKWPPARNVFQATVKPIIERRKAEALLNGLNIIDIFHHQETDPHRCYKSKLRILFQNNTGVPIVVKKPKWNHGKDGVAMQYPQHGEETLQLEGPGGWAENKWLDEKSKVEVRNGVVFRLWIGLNQSYKAVDIRRRQITQRLGKLTLSVVINGCELQWHKQL